MTGYLAEFLIKDPVQRVRPAVLGLALALFGAILALRLAVSDPAEPILLLNLIPISMLAIELGLRGGMAAATVAVAMVGFWSLEADVTLEPSFYVARLIAFFLVGGLVGYLLDQLQATREGSRRLFEFTPTAAVGLGLDGEITSVNFRTLGLFGLRRDDMIGAQIERFLPGFFSELAQRTVRGRPGATFQLLGRGNAGSAFPLDVSVSPWRSEEGALLVSLRR